MIMESLHEQLLLASSYRNRRLVLMKLKIVWILLLTGGFSSCSGYATDVRCLRSLKESLGDPNGALSSWQFSDNATEGYICMFTGVVCWKPSESKVLSLNLGNMGLQGSFPQGVQDCTSMTDLDLSSNSLSGPLPGDIARQLPSMTALNLSYNSFSGEIPSGVGNLTYLNQLSLENNRFTGRIPEDMGDLARLVSLSVADNSLSGPIPGSLQRFSAEDFAGNDGLCGAPLHRKCKTRFHLRIHLRLRRVNDASSIGAAVGFVVGFVVAFYFPQWFVLCGSLRPYIFPVCA